MCAFGVAVARVEHVPSAISRAFCYAHPVFNPPCLWYGVLIAMGDAYASLPDKEGVASLWKSLQACCLALSVCPSIDHFNETDIIGGVFIYPSVEDFQGEVTA